MYFEEDFESADIHGAGLVASREFRKLTTLVVDDSASQRAMLKMLLLKWNFDVLLAKDGIEALEICRKQHIDFVLSDWMMPNMTGLELCSAMRDLEREEYTYFILLTSKNEKNDVAVGFDAGADDFLSKPVDIGELLARMRAGQRQLRMQEDLVDKNRRITEAFDRLNELYESIDRDLRAAAKLQKSLIPNKESMCGPVRISRLYRPAGHVGGDLVGFFQVSDSRIAAYSIDVSGHGVSSALLTARLANLFTPSHFDENIGIRKLPNGEYHPRNPAAVAQELNERLQSEDDSDQYLTMLYADINFDTGQIRFCQAGHPALAVIRREGQVDFVGNGGTPIGLIPDVPYENETVQLEPGDRLMMYSDGITECDDPAGEMFEEERLAKVLSRYYKARETTILDMVEDEMKDFAGGKPFADDVSALLLTMP